MPDQLSPFQAASAAFALASLGGLAALLRSNKPITLRSVLAAVLYSGLVGITIALLWYNYFDGQGNIPFLLGVSGLAGIGGATVVDFLIETLKQGGLNIVISSRDQAAKPPQSGEPK